MDQTPDTPSADHAAMSAYWEMIDAILGGVTTMRAGGEKYLPKFEVEADNEYKARLKQAKFTNVFRDIVENLAQRPFSKEVHVEDGVSADLKAFADDVDARGNSLHVFAGEVFFAGIAKAVDWIMVDYTQGVPPNATIADEKRLGVRPFWRRYPAQSVLAAYSATVQGREEFVHVRLSEPVTIRDGFKEVVKNRVRVLDRPQIAPGVYGPATYEVWEHTESTAGVVAEWELIEGPAPLTIGIIPLVPFITGRRIGMSWNMHPPMRDAADLQIDMYQQENALKNVKNLTAFPMLAANGVAPQVDKTGAPAKITVGPRTVLYGGEKGTWGFIEPGAQSMEFLAKDIKETVAQLRELGRQPLTAQSGNLTVVTTAFAAQKGNAAIQAWAINLKDALERAFQITSMWLKAPTDVDVMIDTDFDLGLGDDDSFGHVITLATGDAPMISREAALHEAKRRGILDPAYDGDEDLETLMEEQDERDLADDPPNAGADTPPGGTGADAP
jgi:hypothetical protein